MIQKLLTDSLALHREHCPLMVRIFRGSHENLMVCVLQDWLWALWLLFSHSVMSDSANPWTAAHRIPCPSPTPRAGSNSCPLSQWCLPTISSSVVPFSYLLSFPASEFFPVSQFFASGGQSIGALASASVLAMNIQDWFPLGWTGLISLLSKGLFRSLLQHHSSKASVLRCSVFFMVQLSHSYMTTGKKYIALTIQSFVSKVMSLAL